MDKPCSTLKSCEECWDNVKCSACGSLNGWICQDKAIGNCVTLSPGACENGEINVGLLILVIFASVAVALALSLSQLRAWLNSDRKIKRWLDEDERMVLHEHPEEVIE